MSLPQILVILCIILVLISDRSHTIVNPPSLLLAPTLVFKPSAFNSLQLWAGEQLCKTSSARGMKDEVPCDRGEERTCSKAHCLCLLLLPSAPDPFLRAQITHPSAWQSIRSSAIWPGRTTETPPPPQESPSPLRTHPDSHLWPGRETGEAEVESLENLLDQREERGASGSQTPNPGGLGC
ncbi:hypothetical protein HJG60_007829 [Phyllostomus discolor]|uniref:Uncharacterized protein n=1 Tax=Phyllostomus discolor TaxID=89673 RepID=A0A834EV56_9CHIR|nr:hypothetical protein HJG60_007829 [Phyllostomus discolor]